MGNWGNTLDRWYHRAAVVVWPREQAFANRAETSPAWALDELAAMASAGEMSGARAAAATLAPFWDGALRARTPEDGSRISGLLGKALRAADAVADAATAAMLLRPFRVENLTADARRRRSGRSPAATASSGRRNCCGRGSAGSSRRGHTAGDRNGRSGWRTGCPACARGCTPRGSAGAAAARRLLDLAWEWIRQGHRHGARVVVAQLPRQETRRPGQPLASVLTAAAATGQPARGTRCPDTSGSRRTR